MKTRSSFIAALAAPLFALVVACSGGSGGGSYTGSTGQSSSGGTQPHCYLAQDESACECVATNEDDSRPATQWKKVSACNESTAGSDLRCFADTKVDGTTTSCNCSPWRCSKSESGSCSCGEYSSTGGTDVTSCTGFEWYCGRLDGTSCYGGNGTFGSACGNDEHNVPSCSISVVRRPKGTLESCDGLRFVAPPPPAPSSGSSSGGCTGCTSDSDCHDKCKRCDRSTCSCVSRLSCN